MEQYVNELLPFNETNTQEIVHEINMIVRSNAIGIPLLAVIQGGVAMLGYWIFDAPNILFLGFSYRLLPVSYPWQVRHWYGFP